MAKAQAEAEYQMINLMEENTTTPIRPKQAVKKKFGEEPKLAAIAISLNVRLRSADMPATMQELALRYARSLLDSCSHRPNPSLLARSLKKEFDGMYGPAWHCVVGKSFGSFVTHSPGGFLYFSLGSDLCFLLFKTEVRLVNEVD